MPAQLSVNYNQQYNALPCRGGMGNALLHIMYAGVVGHVINSIQWSHAHTRSADVLQPFVTLPVISKFRSVSNTDFNFQQQQLQSILRRFKQDKRNLRYINMDMLERIKRKRDTACVHLRFGDFVSLRKWRYLPDKKFLYTAIEKLPKYVNNLKIVSNGTAEQIDSVLCDISNYGKYNIQYTDSDENRPDTALTEMLQCGSMIRTGSTLSLCACLMQSYDVIVSSFMTQSPHDTERFNIDLPGSSAIIVS